MCSKNRCGGVPHTRGVEKAFSPSLGGEHKHFFVLDRREKTVFAA